MARLAQCKPDKPSAFGMLISRAPLQHQSHTAEFASFSPDGNLIAYSGSSGMLTLWDVKLQKPRRSWSAHPAAIDAVAFSADGRLLASSTEGMVKLWDVRSGAELARFAGLEAFVFSLMFTPDGKNLIGCDIMGQVRLWHLPSLREAGTLRTPIGLVSGALSRDGNVLATCSLEGGVRIFPCRFNNASRLRRLTPAKARYRVFFLV